MGIGFKATLDCSFERAEAWLMMRNNGRKWYFVAISCAGKIDAIASRNLKSGDNRKLACLLKSQMETGVHNLHLIQYAPFVAMPDCR